MLLLSKLKQFRLPGWPHFSINDAFNELTVRVKDTVFDTAPAVPVTVTGYCPAGVDVDVDNVKEVLQVGLHDVRENEEPAPEGRAETLKETGWMEPASGVAVTVIDVDCPCVRT